MSGFPIGEMHYGEGKTDMESVVLVIFHLCLAVSIHGLLHRITKRRKAVTMKSTVIYVVVFSMLYISLNSIGSTLIYSSMMLYSCSSLLIAYLYAGVVLGGETPSSMILHALSRRHHMSEKECVELFTEDMLVWKRIADLCRANLITKTGDHMNITTKGSRVVWVIGLYERVFFRHHGG